VNYSKVRKVGTPKKQKNKKKVRGAEKKNPTDKTGKVGTSKLTYTLWLTTLEGMRRAKNVDWGKGGEG